MYHSDLFSLRPAPYHGTVASCPHARQGARKVPLRQRCFQVCPGSRLVRMLSASSANALAARAAVRRTGASVLTATCEEAAGRSELNCLGLAPNCVFSILPREPAHPTSKARRTDNVMTRTS